MRVRSEYFQLYLVLVLSVYIVFTVRYLLNPLQLLHGPSQPPRAPGYFAICASVKDQSDDIAEWVQYHEWLGAEKIYLYDHNSTVPAEQVLQGYIKKGLVDYTFFTGHHNPKTSVFADTAQGYAYTQCLERLRGKFEWVAFLDIDEFLVLYDPPHRNVSALLEKFEGYGGIAVNWRVFGSSGHVCRPELPTLEAYTRCIPGPPINQHVKAIVRLRYTDKIGGTPHTFNYLPGHYAVSEHRRKCSAARCQPVTLEHIGVHHYVLKSFQHYVKKMARRGGSGSVKQMKFFHGIDKLASSTCIAASEISRTYFRWPPPGPALPCHLTPNDVRDLTYLQHNLALGVLLEPANLPQLPERCANATAAALGPCVPVPYPAAQLAPPPVGGNGTLPGGNGNGTGGLLAGPGLQEGWADRLWAAAVKETSSGDDGPDAGAAARKLWDSIRHTLHGVQKAVQDSEQAVGDGGSAGGRNEVTGASWRASIRGGVAGARQYAGSGSRRAPPGGAS